MKQKIEIELDIPDGFELEYYEVSKNHVPIGNKCFGFSGFYYLKPIEPPLELETEKFLKGSASTGYQIDGFYARLYVYDKPDTIQVSNEPIIASPSEARDLAKILNYWAEHGKLPKVTVKEAREPSPLTEEENKLYMEDKEAE